MPELEVAKAARESREAAPWMLRRTELGGSALSKALQVDPSFQHWLAPRPSSLEAWRTRVDDIRRRAGTADWLTPLAPAIAATGRAAERLGRAAAQGVVVTTGQQPGLFGGPAYTWSKAISALAMADALEEATGVPVAPVFWAASDDADWAEAAITHFATAQGLQAVSLAGPPTDGVAMAHVPLGPLDGPLEALRAACGSIAHESYLRLVEHAYVPHATVGASYVQLLRAVLEPLGIAVIDAAHPALRSAADPLLRKALQQAPAIQEALALRSRAIIDAGFSVQVDVMDELSLVFRTQAGESGRERDRVRARIPLSDAARVVREADAGSLGPNVLLRPVLEKALLPTVAYHAGPGEFAYFAQVGPVAEILGLDVPLVIPRWSGEVIEHRMEAMREALGLEMSALMDPHAAETVVARSSIEADVQDAIERLRVAIETQARAVGDAISHADGIVAPEVVAGLAADLERRVQRFERRVVSGAKRRESTLMREVAAVRAALRPGGYAPERCLNLLPMLARYGPSILHAMQADAREYCDQLVRGT